MVVLSAALCLANAATSSLCATSAACQCHSVQLLCLRLRELRHCPGHWQCQRRALRLQRAAQSPCPPLRRRRGHFVVPLRRRCVGRLRQIRVQMPVPGPVPMPVPRWIASAGPTRSPSPSSSVPGAAEVRRLRGKERSPFPQQLRLFRSIASTRCSDCP